MNLNYDLNYVVDFMVKLLKTPSPTGDTEKALTLVKEELKKYGLEIKENEKHGFYVSIEGKNKEKEVTFSAHVDTLGAMVKELKPNGRLKLSLIGGFAWNVIEGLEVTINTIDKKQYTGTIMTTVASSHVFGSETSTTERKADTMELRVDEKVESEEDLRKLGINVGDFIYFDTATRVTESGFIKSRHLDDKACVACMIGAIKAIVENNIKPNYTTNFFISNYEEVGHGSSAGLPEKTFEFIAVDMAAPGPGQSSSEFKVTVCAKDSTGPYDKEIKERLIRLCKENNIPHAIDIYPFYGSDASAALSAGWDFRAGLIGPGVDASHSFERTHKEAVDATVKLILAYIQDER